jgi:hypothetical protein
MMLLAVAKAGIDIHEARCEQRADGKYIGWININIPIYPNRPHETARHTLYGEITYTQRQKLKRVQLWRRYR